MFVFNLHWNLSSTSSMSRFLRFDWLVDFLSIFDEPSGFCGSLAELINFVGI